MEIMKNMKGFGLRPNGEASKTKRLCSDFSQHVLCEVLISATAFFMSFMLSMVKYILGSDRSWVASSAFSAVKTP